MARTKDILWDAERLAQFSNASDEREARKYAEDLFPPDFWTRRGVTDLWGIMGAASQDILTARPPLLGRIGKLPFPFWAQLQEGLRAAWQEGFPLEACIALISLAGGHVPPQVWTYQRAVMFLGMDPWRARFCAVCGKRFVADKPARRFCSPACSGKARQATRAESWKRHGEKWRATYETRKAGRKRGLTPTKRQRQFLNKGNGR